MPAAAHGHAVGALAAAAAVVPAHKEIVVAAVAEDERGLDGVGAGMARRGILLLVGSSRSVAARYGLWRGGQAQRGAAVGGRYRREGSQLNAVPERAPRHPQAVVVVNNEVRVDGVPVVAILAASHQAATVVPVGSGQRRGREQPDGRGVPAKRGTTVGHPPAAVPANDVGGPDVAVESGHAVARPLRNVAEHAVALHVPSAAVGRGHGADVRARAEEIAASVFKGQHGVVYERRVGGESHGAQGRSGCGVGGLGLRHNSRERGAKRQGQEGSFHKW